MVNLNPVISY